MKLFDEISRRPLLCASLFLSLGACSRSAPSAQTPKNESPPSVEPKREASEPQTPRLDLFAFGRQLGAIAPCGCTADPLGGLQYAFGYIESHSEDARRAVLHGGSFLFPDPEGPNAAKDPAEWGQIGQRAAILTKTFQRYGQALHLGIGPTDLSSPEGLTALQTHKAPRTVANLPLEQLPDTQAWRTIEFDAGLRAAVTHIVDPQLSADPPFNAATDPKAALQALLPKMKVGGTDLIVVTVQGTRAFADELALAVSGVDIMVVTGPIAALEEARLGASPTLRGDTWVLQPGDQAQTISHVRLSIPDAIAQKAAQNPEIDAIDAANQWALQTGAAQRKAEAERVRERLERFRKDPSADPNFLARLEAELQKLESGTPDLPKDRVAITIEQAKVSCHGNSDSAAQKALSNYDQWVATQNKKRFTGVHAPKPGPGERGYVGQDTCAGCHPQAADFWKNTVHARAFETLERANKQYDLACVSCHVTGFRKPGGSELVENKGLRDVQCEQCHGPGSAHVEKPSAATISREAPSTVCLDCHTPEHSDTFQYEAYLRDILGPGHGEKARKALGAGPTGAQLRANAVKAAGGSCKKAM